MHSQRLNSLSRLHSTLAWISEGGGPRKSLTYMEREALMTWHPVGTIVVRGIQFRGMIETTPAQARWPGHRGCNRVA